ncbi:hypothetical protein [Streptomyces litchfieldiae]|uniref:2'-5' RNA ligase superfamily protein n=1 Tax=Streptomyces litchfieldiae TaxID=3075543 RepID=A0ABU2MJS6_9ACTN|nr:hypothetical protein [Streptomyces sp. DSM 44938]MDT0341731.1 hypothetical protein [Streptomyces sp. DSM 44938]
MPFAIELLLDPAADRRVREIWAALDAHGVPSLGTNPGGEVRPHVTLSVFDGYDAERLPDAARPLLRGALGTPLALGPGGRRPPHRGAGPHRCAGPSTHRTADRPAHRGRCEGRS